MSSEAPALPGTLRRRVVLGTVAAVVAGVFVLAAIAVGVHHSVWMQARAEWLAASEPHVTARYLGWDSDEHDGAGIHLSFSDDEYVRLESGRTLRLWRPEYPASDVVLDDSVEVVVFPGEDRAFVADELPDATYPAWQRIVDWLGSLALDGLLFFALVLSIAYGAVWLVLGFSPFALPSLLRRREHATALLVDYARPVKPSEVLLTATIGDSTYQWAARTTSDAPLRIDGTLHLVGHPREGGWVVAWTADAHLVPAGPMRAPDAEAVQP